MGATIKEPVAKELIRQMNHEYAAAHAYQALAIWCDDQNLKGFARFFHKQAGEEREHAEKFLAHLLDRGVAPALTAIPEPQNAFKSVMEIARKAQDMEQTNTLGINQAYESALQNKDYPAQVLLHWFITEQVEEEAWCQELVERVERANCAGGLGELDRHLERHLKESGAAEAEAD